MKKNLCFAWPSALQVDLEGENTYSALEACVIGQRERGHKVCSPNCLSLRCILVTANTQTHWSMSLL